MVQEIARQIERLARGLATVRELEVWLVGNLQRVLDSRDEEAIGLANAVDADLVELGEGLIEMDEFHERLESYLRQLETVRVSPHHQQEIATGTGTQVTIRRRRVGLWCPALTG